MKFLIIAAFCLMTVLAGVQDCSARRVSVLLTDGGPLGPNWTPDPPYHVGEFDTLVVTNRTSYNLRIHITDYLYNSLDSKRANIFESAVFTYLRPGSRHICPERITAKGVEQEGCADLYTSVPTTTEWGVVALLILLVGAGITMVIRRHQTKTP